MKNLITLRVFSISERSVRMLTKLRKSLLVLVAAFMFTIAGGALTASAVTITNGSFESGFTGWDVTNMAIPWVHPQQVVGAGHSETGYGFFLTDPTDGNYVHHSTFDGGGPDSNLLSQSLLIDETGYLSFDYRAAWRLSGGSSQDRIFSVNIHDGGDITTFTILSTDFASTLYVPDTGALSATLDLSAWVGSTITMEFEWYVPEYFTGPAAFQLDNIQFTSVAVPEPATILLLGSGLIGLAFFRRKEETV